MFELDWWMLGGSLCVIMAIIAFLTELFWTGGGNE